MSFKTKIPVDQTGTFASCKKRPLFFWALGFKYNSFGFILNSFNVRRLCFCVKYFLQQKNSRLQNES